MKERTKKMIENKTEVNQDLDKALQALERAKQHVANEKKKQSEKKRKAGKSLPPPHNPLSQLILIREKIW